MAEKRELTLDKIYHASYVLKDVIRKTEMIHAPELNGECEVYLKTENLQVTGSFKVRGARRKRRAVWWRRRPATMPRAWRWRRRKTAFPA